MTGAGSRPWTPCSDWRCRPWIFDDRLRGCQTCCKLCGKPFITGDAANRKSDEDKKKKEKAKIKKEPNSDTDDKFSKIVELLKGFQGKLNEEDKRQLGLVVPELADKEPVVRTPAQQRVYEAKRLAGLEEKAERLSKKATKSRVQAEEDLASFNAATQEFVDFRAQVLEEAAAREAAAAATLPPVPELFAEDDDLAAVLEESAMDGNGEEEAKLKRDLQSYREEQAKLQGERARLVELARKRRKTETGGTRGAAHPVGEQAAAAAAATASLTKEEAEAAKASKAKADEKAKEASATAATSPPEPPATTVAGDPPTAAPSPSAKDKEKEKEELIAADAKTLLTQTIAKAEAKAKAEAANLKAKGGKK